MSSASATQNGAAGWPISPRVEATITAPMKPTRMPAMPSAFGRRMPRVIDISSVRAGESVYMMPV